MRKKFDYRSGSRSAYEAFCKNHPNASISFNEWLEVIYGFNEEFRNYILETGEKEKLPSGLGAFSINKKKRKIKVTDPTGAVHMNLPIDWKKTLEKGRVIYNFNYHTEGYYFGWMWFKHDTRVKNGFLWMFKPSRVTSRMLAHYIFKGDEYQHKYRQWKN